MTQNLLSFWQVLALFVIVAGCGTRGGPLPEADYDLDGGIITNEVIIAFHPETTQERIQALLDSLVTTLDGGVARTALPTGDRYQLRWPAELGISQDSLVLYLDTLPKVERVRAGAFVTPSKNRKDDSKQGA